MTTINQLLFSGLFAVCFFVPGWLVLQTLNIRRHRFLLSIALSYALLTGILAALQHFKLPFACFAPSILGCSIIFGALGLARFAWMRYCRKERSRFWRSGPFRFRPGLLIPFAALMVLVWIYLWWAGPYLEISSDVWNHIFCFRNAIAQINAGAFGEAAASPYGAFVSQRNDWYLIIAHLMRWSGISDPQVLMPLTVVTVSTFCAGIFFCALAVFRPFRISIRKRGWLAAGAAMFCAVTMGSNVFAYIRYYAFAPTILNYLLFLSATLVALDWFNARRWWTNAIWLIPALILTMNVVHSQEVLFSCFMIMGLALANICMGIKIHSGSREPRLHEIVAENPIQLKGRAKAGPYRAVWERSTRSACFVKSLIVAGLALAAWLGIFYWLRHKNPIVWPDAHAIMPNMPISAVSAPLIFKAFTISPPTNPIVRLFVYQFYTFYQTIGCWGFFVYIVFLLGFREMAKSNYLLAGMASPLFTVFNPITIDLFVRLITLQSHGMPPVTIWRFSYILPLSFVAAFAFGSAVESLTRRTRRKSAGPFEKHPNAALIKAAVIIIGLVGLIFPINNRWVDAPFSRLYTLARHFGNDAGRWRDLTDFVAGFHNSMLVTDPNTSRIFSLLYPEYPLGGLQWMDSNEPETQFSAATQRQPELRTRGLIIINRRDGIPSVTGRISKHWPEDAFLTSRFYNPKAIAFVESHTNQFELLWARNQIEVFRIIP